MKKVLITGSNGQLGQCLQIIASLYKNLELTFKNSKDLDITDAISIKKTFDLVDFDYCINCAAYTDVEQAEKTPDIAFKVNAEGVKNLAFACKKRQVSLIHISTDYVFDGEKNEPYTTDDIPNPINEYGKSKLMGEKYIQELMVDYIIIRTSWLYSEFEKNFYTSILKKAKSGENLSVTDSQTGCPTNANNLANYILTILSSNDKFQGIYHFTDGEILNWFEFAEKILANNNLTKNVRLEKVKNYRTFARRPKYSVLHIL
ncbi:dTDP-4-dehydrorhamnose reductase [Maribacter stanieri]|uniref:dTDP-4-dehydrorhamnose reductase n=1 Tax=Maribacter stanieri TaxID=440514 RepID=UPI0024950ACA|nr:dTDP-4-dehydrorhamnose reductase [Maribacter stanieri]|tara:strand:+ start:3996 stop:4775 length:780 start_codon:yes stop_codon:yes gene_type:complete